MSCCCSHIVTRWNPCCCQPGPTTTSSTTTTTLCPNGELCDEVVDPRCIIYNGPDIPCYGIETGDSAADILDIIIGYFICPTTTTTTLVPTTTTSSTTTTTTVEPTTTTTLEPTTTTTTTGGPTTTTTTSNVTTTTTSNVIFRYTIDAGYTNCNGVPLPPGTNQFFSIESTTPIPIRPGTDIYTVNDYPNLGDVYCWNILVAGPYDGVSPTYPISLVTGCQDCPGGITTTSTTSSTTTTSTTSTSTTSTTTTAPTTTTTTGEPLPKSTIEVENQLSLGGAEISDIQFDSVSIVLSGNYPILPSSAEVGNENNGTYTVEVFFTGITGTESITITDSTGSSTCNGLFTGQTSQVFSGQVLNDTLGNPFTITLKPGPC